jgi:hypothetical protein
VATIKEWRDDAREASKVVSDQVRTLSLGGLALIWAFKPEAAPQATADSDTFWGVESLAVTLPGALQTAAFLFVIALLLDFLQHLLRSTLYGEYTSSALAAGKKETDEARAPYRINWPHRFCYWLKIAASVAGMFVLVASFFPDWLRI